MKTCTIVDTGPLVALFNAADSYHAWATEHFARLPPPLLTCEAVIGETCFLLARGRLNPAHVLDAIVRGALRLDFSLVTEVESVRQVMNRYRDAGVSLADACLVRMSEVHAHCQVMTVDRDFLIYRRYGRRTIPLIAPFA